MKREPAILEWNRGFALVCVLRDAVEGTVMGNDAAQNSVIGDDATLRGKVMGRRAAVQTGRVGRFGRGQLGLAGRFSWVNRFGRVDRFGWGSAWPGGSVWLWVSLAGWIGLAGWVRPRPLPATRPQRARCRPFRRSPQSVRRHRLRPEPCARRTWGTSGSSIRSSARGSAAGRSG